jgi:pyrroloquinoline quinone (PQQ) biosynthesis protein C
MSAKEDEGSHDRWALNDALALGMSEAAVYAVQPSEAVKAYRAYTGYLARHQPVGVLGVAYVLETFGCERAGQAATNLVTHSGIPSIEKAVSFLAGHGTEDQDHVRILAEVLSDVHDPRDAAVVELAAELTIQLYPSFFHGG